MNNITSILIAGMILLLGTGCSQEPAEIHYGSDECVYCKMMITDDRFATQIVTDKGKVIKFDSIECMADYTGEHKSELESAKFWLSDFNNPGNWVEVGKAKIVKSDVIKSPMGESLMAFKNSEEMKNHLSEYPGTPIEWERLVK